MKTSKDHFLTCIFLYLKIVKCIKSPNRHYCMSGDNLNTDNTVSLLPNPSSELATKLTSKRGVNVSA